MKIFFKKVIFNKLNVLLQDMYFSLIITMPVLPSSFTSAGIFILKSY